MVLRSFLQRILQFPATDFIQDLFIEMKLLDCGHTHQAGNLEMSLIGLLLEHLRQENNQDENILKIVKLRP